MLRVLGFLLIALLCAEPALSKPTPASIPMVRGKKVPVFLVEGTVDDRHQALFLVDTGATETVIAEWFVRKHGLKFSKKEKTAQDSSGAKVTLRHVKLASLTFGSEQESSPREIPVIRLPSKLRTLGIAGILSPQSHFDGRPFTLDFPERKLRSHAGTDVVQFGTEAEIKSVSPCADHPRKMVVTAYVGDLEGKFFLDTSEPRSTVTANFARRMQDHASSPSPSPSSRRIRTSKVKKELKNIAIRFGSFNQPFSLDVNTKNLGCRDADGKLGVDLLGRFRLGFSSDRSSVQLSK